MNISKLTLGTVQFGMNYGIANTQGKPSFEKVVGILSAAYENGIRFLDTAAAYGDSEIVLGKALKQLGILDSVKIVSKISPVPKDASEEAVRAHVRKSLGKSLENLGIPKLYAILFHVEDDVRYLPILRECVADGMAEKAGVSLDSHVPEEAKNCDAVQIPDNVLDRRFLPFLKEAHAKGTHIFVRSVYLQGLLLMPEEKIPEKIADVIPYRRKLEQIAAANGMPLSELCMRYLLSIPEIDSVLTGVDSVEQLQANVALAERGALPESVMNEIFAAIPDLPERLIRPSCWYK
ncbi:MAG: aldo/keto reductase [Victivallales bacterium]|nr:aldo/keto reductase [Victivallales bacterium]